MLFPHMNKRGEGGTKAITTRTIWSKLWMDDTQVLSRMHDIRLVYICRAMSAVCGEGACAFCRRSQGRPCAGTELVREVGGIPSRGQLEAMDARRSLNCEPGLEMQAESFPPFSSVCPRFKSFSVTFTNCPSFLHLCFLSPSYRSTHHSCDTP